VLVLSLRPIVIISSAASRARPASIVAISYVAQRRYNRIMAVLLLPSWNAVVCLDAAAAALSSVIVALSLRRRSVCRA
jgi:hypothetical protein